MVVTTVIGILAIVITGIVMKNGDEPGVQESKQLGIIAYNAEFEQTGGKPTKTLAEWEAFEVNRVKEDIAGSASLMINFAYYLAIITIAALILFGVIWPLVKNPKSMKQFLIFSGVLAIFLVVLWFAVKGAQPTELELAEFKEENQILAKDSYGMASWGIYSMIILSIVAGIAWIGGSLYSTLKR